MILDYCDRQFTNVDIDQVHRDIAAASAELQEKTARNDCALGTPIVQMMRGH